MKQKSFRGFTLIELLVVIAIIGILATVVIGAVNSARSKGGDAAVKANLQALRTEAEFWYDSNNAYATTAITGACPTAYSATGTNFVAGSKSATEAVLAVNKQQATGVTATCQISIGATSAWAASAPLKVQNQFGTSSGADHFCVDSAGSSKVVDNVVATTICP
jgi:prepilin-type N-terminal cleavage/methylation domain-containing protein